ncbi:MAG: aminotransferase class III-fold pyridoxal phosphate-dependent enzyme, partial [Myxococcaceae bacterium]|nr:aminotransferase class III-fold pyridoxal phosphate-dependent enzyme [Myxococcaceae bacterium]
SNEVLGVFRPGDHGSTFGGNPLGCAVACAALDVLVDEDLVHRSARLGQRLFDGLKKLSSPLVREVRGRGLWVGIELDRPARPLCEALMARGVLCKETHDKVIRVAPPLVVTEEQIDQLVEHFQAVLS